MHHGDAASPACLAPAWPIHQLLVCDSPASMLSVQCELRIVSFCCQHQPKRLHAAGACVSCPSGVGVCTYVASPTAAAPTAARHRAPRPHRPHEADEFVELKCLKMTNFVVRLSLTTPPPAP
eukprot:5256837-Pleurochrysis_carterae.AAC.1